MSHLRNFERIAFTHPSGSRSILNAYNQSAEYVWNLLRGKTGCDLKRQYFQAPIHEITEEGCALKSTNGNGKDVFVYQYGKDFRVMRYGGVSAHLSGVQVQRITNVGCVHSDYAGFKRGQIALIESNSALFRSQNCSQWEASYQAQKAGASAIMWFNTLERKELSNARVRIVNWKEGDPLMKIPVLSISHALGQYFDARYSGPEFKIDLKADAKMTLASTFNILCETREGDPDRVVMLGAHLDSVPAGPGLVDNASGSSSLLESVLQFYAQGVNKHIKNQVRFAWWAAEEIGLMGSRHYVRELLKTPEEAAKLLVYANHDMLASPNYIPYIYDGASVPAETREISVFLTSLYEEYYRSLPVNHKFHGLYDLEAMTGGSDFWSFIESGIPSGGVATGAGSLKSDEERHRFGGLANAAMDPCYHQKCDNVDNIGQDVLQVMAKALAFVMHRLAHW